MNATWKRGIIIVVGAALLAGGWALANEQIAEQEDLNCTACHDKPGSKLLTDRGVYYEFKGTMDGYEKLSDTFGRCTSCHVRKPGSTKLTKQGKRFNAIIADMDELRVWLDEQHPEPATDLPVGKDRR